MPRYLAVKVENEGGAAKPWLWPDPQTLCAATIRCDELKKLLKLSDVEWHQISLGFTKVYSSAYYAGVGPAIFPPGWLTLYILFESQFSQVSHIFGF